MYRYFTMAFTSIAMILLLPFGSPATSLIPRHRRDTANNHVVPALLEINDTNNHAYWYRRLLRVELSPAALTCARNGTVLHHETKKCHWLLEQGPCAPSEWLVLPEGGSERPVCSPRPCAPRHALLEGEQPPRCAPLDALCAQRPDRELRFSLRGEARCQCKGFRAQGPDGRCHVLYAQGACPSGQILMPTYSSSLDSSIGTCMANPCADGEMPVMTEHAQEIECQSLGSMDCASTFMALFDAAMGLDVPVCTDSKRGVIRPVARPSSCIRDNRGNCATPRIASLDPYDWGIGQDDRIVFADRSALPYLEGYLARYSVFSFMGI